MVDGDDLDQLDDLLTEDATFEVVGLTPAPVVGREAIKAFVAGFEPAPRQHTCSNVSIDVQGREATVRSKFLCPMPDGSWLVGSYDDRFVEVGATWRLASRRVRITP